MKYSYIDYSNQEIGPDAFWPRWDFVAGAPTEAALEAAVFVERLNGVLSDLGGFYFRRDREHLDRLGRVKGYTHVRFFDAYKGIQFNAVYHESGVVDADLIANNIFRVFNYAVSNFAGMAVLNVNEGLDFAHCCQGGHTVT